MTPWAAHNIRIAVKSRKKVRGRDSSAGARI